MSDNVNNLYGLCAGCSNAIVDEDFVIIDGSRYHNDSNCLPAVAEVGTDSLEYDEVEEIETDGSEPDGSTR